MLISLQALATEFGKPFVTVHHLEAHCLTARLAGILILPKNETQTNTNTPVSTTGGLNAKVQYPFMALVASGGHTSIMLCRGLGEYEVLGGTRDDALGEAFDKASRLLGLPMNISGGAAVESFARKGKSIFPLTSPMKGSTHCDFSYAGKSYSDHFDFIIV